MTQRRLIIWFCWITGITISALVISRFLSPEYTTARRALRESASRGALLSLADSLRDYEFEYGSLPPAVKVSTSGKPSGWRVILEEHARRNLGMDFAYNFDRDWNSKTNLAVADEGARLPFDWDLSEKRRTRFVAVIGPGTAFPMNGPVSVTQIRDGPSNTALLIELNNSAFGWTEPKDISIDQLGRYLKPTNNFRPALLFADYQVHRLNRAASEDVMQALFTIDGGEAIDRDELLKRGILVRGG